MMTGLLINSPTAAHSTYLALTYNHQTHRDPTMERTNLPSPLNTSRSLMSVESTQDSEVDTLTGTPANADVPDEPTQQALAVWPLTCGLDLVERVIGLNEAFHTLLSRFFMDPTVARELLDDSDAVICGEGALDVIMHDGPGPVDVLDIIVIEEEYDLLVSRLIETDGVYEKIQRVHDVGVDSATKVERHITAVSRFELEEGRLIYLHCTNTLSPVTPLARMPCTIMMNFVTGRAVGCAYPGLTLARQSVVCDRIPVSTVLQHEKEAIRRLKERGITFTFPRSRCADRERVRVSDGQLEPTDKEEAYLCPSAVRYFGDADSLLVSVEPDALGSPHGVKVPYGATAIFRLPVKTECDGEHVPDEQLLPRSIDMLETVILGDTYFNLTDNSERSFAAVYARGRPHAPRRSASA